MSYYIEVTDHSSDIIEKIYQWCDSNLKYKEDWNYIKDDETATGEDPYDMLYSYFTRSFFVIKKEEDYIVFMLMFGEYF